MNTLIHFLRGKSSYVMSVIIMMAMYAPAKDLLSFASQRVAKSSIELASISYGSANPWQNSVTQDGFVKASQSLSQPQQIFTKFTLSNPSNEPVTYRKIWLYFEHENGNREYTTDYTLYDPETRQRLIGHSIELGPNSNIEVLASYRFIPSYNESAPETVSISWESDSHYRDTSCSYKLPTKSLSQFGVTCE